MKDLKPQDFFDLSAYKHSKLFENCSYVWEALSNIKPYLDSYPLGVIESEIPEGVYLANPELISIGKNTELEPGAYIKGPCIIGDNCSIRHSAYIRGYIICGDYSVIGHATEIKCSILLNNASAAHFAYLGDTIIGNSVNLGAGTRCANLRFDKQSVIVHYDGKKIDTGRRKLGAIFGDGSVTGCNAVTNPGTLLAKGAVCYPSANVGGVILPWSGKKT